MKLPANILSYGWDLKPTPSTTTTDLQGQQVQVEGVARLNVDVPYLLLSFYWDRDALVDALIEAVATEATEVDLMFVDCEHDYDTYTGTFEFRAFGERIEIDLDDEGRDFGPEDFTSIGIDIKDLAKVLHDDEA